MCACVCVEGLSPVSAPAESSQPPLRIAEMLEDRSGAPLPIATKVTVCVWRGGQGRNKRMSLRACMRASVCVCVCVCERERESVCESVCVSVCARVCGMRCMHMRQALSHL